MSLKLCRRAVDAQKVLDDAGVEDPVALCSCINCSCDGQGVPALLDEYWNPRADNMFCVTCILNCQFRAEEISRQGGLALCP